MPEPTSYTAYYKPVPLGFGFYFLLVFLAAAIVFNVINLVWPFSDEASWRNMFTPYAHFVIFYITAERMYKQYKNSKIKNCFVRVDDSGITWNLDSGNYNVKEREVIAWKDVKKIVVDKDKITVKYMTTYFSDSIPFEKMAVEDRQLLVAALADQIAHRSIPFENREAA